MFLLQMSAPASSSSIICPPLPHVSTVVFPPNDTSWKHIIRGKRPFLGGFNHWAIKIGNYWFEIAGESKSAAQEQNKIVVHIDDGDYTNLSIQQQMTNATYEQIQEFCEEWLANNSHYKLNGANCQQFVKDAIEEFGQAHVPTENRQVGDSITKSGMLAVVGGLLAIFIGKAIRGSH